MTAEWHVKLSQCGTLTKQYQSIMGKLPMALPILFQGNGHDSLAHDNSTRLRAVSFAAAAVQLTS